MINENQISVEGREQGSPTHRCSDTSTNNTTLRLSWLCSLFKTGVELFILHNN